MGPATGHFSGRMNPAPPSADGVPPRRVFRIAYSLAGDDESVPRLHQTRDGDAALELMPPLARHGCEFDSALHFYPNLPRPRECFSKLRPSDLLLLTTRPPIEHLLNEVRILRGRQPIPSGNDLEAAIFTAILPFFDVESRLAIEVSAAVAPWLNKVGQDYAALEFTRYSHALISHRGVHGQKHAFGRSVSPRLRHTVGYFIKLQSIPVYGCGLICCFAPGGVENLLFARHVRQARPAWLAPAWQGFAMVRFTVPDAAEDTPLSAAAFDGEIAPEILAEHTFAVPPRGA
jgi:hypothetical protein